VFVPLRDEDAAIALVTNPASAHPALTPLRTVLQGLTPADVLG
jgi:hypothetical protein